MFQKDCCTMLTHILCREIISKVMQHGSAMYPTLQRPFDKVEVHMGHGHMKGHMTRSTDDFVGYSIVSSYGRSFMKRHITKPLDDFVGHLIVSSYGTYLMRRHMTKPTDDFVGYLLVSSNARCLMKRHVTKPMDDFVRNSIIYSCGISFYPLG